MIAIEALISWLFFFFLPSPPVIACRSLTGNRSRITVAHVAARTTIVVLMCVDLHAAPLTFFGYIPTRSVRRTMWHVLVAPRLPERCPTWRNVLTSG